MPQHLGGRVRVPFRESVGGRVREGGITKELRRRPPFGTTLAAKNMYLGASWCLILRILGSEGDFGHQLGTNVVFLAY